MNSVDSPASTAFSLGSKTPKRLTAQRCRRNMARVMLFVRRRTFFRFIHHVTERTKAITAIKTSRLVRKISILGAILCLLAFATPALAGGGNVLPPTAEPRGYSLTEAAAVTAKFNEDTSNLNTYPRNFPFQILYVSPDQLGTFSVKLGTMLYIPFYWSDDSPPILGDFPDDVNDQEAVAYYYFDPTQLGAEFKIVVDGNVTILGPGYAVGAEVPELPTGGNNYTTVGAFLTPLSKGTHTVVISGYFSGDTWDLYGGAWEFTIPYTVIVR